MTTKAEPQASAIRPDLRSSISGAPASPYTPPRGISSNYSSPGPAHGFYRYEDYRVIFELGSRYIRAGHEGEAAPQCVTKLGPEESRRHGDYRGWQGPTVKTPGTVEDIQKWGDDCELWRTDLKDVDLGLMGDKLERAIRLAHANHLLTGPGDNRLALIIPSVLPKPVISSILATLFNRWKYSSIMLLPSPTMAAVSAGLRSALVVDIGWRETITTAIYEYREISAMRTNRAMRMMTQEMTKQFIPENQKESSKICLPFDFDFAEDLIFRLAWCKQIENRQRDGTTDAREVVEHMVLSNRKSEMPAIDKNAEIKVDWPVTSTPKNAQIPFSTFAEPAEQTFFTNGRTRDSFDDDDLPIPELIFKTLVGLPPDIRAICMSRIVFVGGGSKVPGLSHRVFSEIGELLNKYGWDNVRGTMADKQRERHHAMPPNIVGSSREDPKDVKERMAKEMASGQPMLRSVDRNTIRQSQTAPEQGVLRQVDSLGPWVGASLINSLKVKGLVEVEREEFLQHGLTRAHRDGEISAVPKRMSYGANVPRGGDRTSLTLAGWA